MKTIYELNIPPIPALSTRERMPDGFGKRVIAKYTRVMIVNVYLSVNKDTKETARIMGMNEQEIKKYLGETK